MSEPDFAPGQTQDRIREMFVGKAPRREPTERDDFAPMSCGYDEPPRLPWGAFIQAALFTAALVGLGLYLFITKAVHR